MCDSRLSSSTEKARHRHALSDTVLILAGFFLGYGTCMEYFHITTAFNINPAIPIVSILAGVFMVLFIDHPGEKAVLGKSE